MNPAVAADPNPAMQRLAPLAGEFRVEGIRHTPDGPVALEPTEASIVFTLNGLALREESQSDMGRDVPVNLLTWFTWDPYREVYRIAVMDDSFGVMDIYEGRFVSEHRLVATNLRSNTYFPLEDGARMHFQLRWDLAAMPKTFDVLYTTDGGASWQPYFEMIYKALDRLP